MQIGLFSSRAILRTMRISSAFCAWVPWEKFSRATSRPARTSSRKTSSLLLAGPRVATILARRGRSAASRPEAAGAASGLASAATDLGAVLAKLFTDFAGFWDFSDFLDFTFDFIWLRARVLSGPPRR